MLEQVSYLVDIAFHFYKHLPWIARFQWIIVGWLRVKSICPISWSNVYLRLIFCLMREWDWMKLDGWNTTRLKFYKYPIEKISRVWQFCRIKTSICYCFHTNCACILAIWHFHCVLDFDCVVYFRMKSISLLDALLKTW